MKRRILIVDDDAELRELLHDQLKMYGYEPFLSASGEEAIALATKGEIDVVLTDVRMPGMSGHQLCREIVQLVPNVPVIIMTGFGSMQSAVDAIRAGAYDFVTKPFEPEELDVVVSRALETRALRDEVRRLRRQTGDVPGFEGMIGTSAPMQRLYDLIDRVGHSEASVLIQGQSGTGKELVAKALHHRSRRLDGPFVALNCAAVPESLLESELFGHEKGAFTDARVARPGLMRKAEGGTVFLDEIGDLSHSLQPKLLRALQERVIRPVGGDREIPIDVRVIAATHRDLNRAVEDGAFRADLYYRLNVITIDVPPLCEREDDILLIAEAFLEEITGRENRKAPELSTDAAHMLLRHSWPGNVRELHNCMERCVALCAGSSIGVEHLPPDMVARIREHHELNGVDSVKRSESQPEINGSSDAPFLPLFEIERRHILRVLDQVEGNKTHAAKILGIDRKTLHTKLVRYGRA
jgi:two-component system, NtrC family, response regulator AtoC